MRVVDFDALAVKVGAELQECVVDETLNGESLGGREGVPAGNGCRNLFVDVCGCVGVTIDVAVVVESFAKM